MSDEVLVFVGSLNRDGRGAGLGVYRFDEGTLAVEKLAETGEIDNPSFLSVTAGGGVFAVSEVSAWREGVVTAYRFDRGGGAARLRQQAADARQRHGARHGVA